MSDASSPTEGPAGGSGAPCAISETMFRMAYERINNALVAVTVHDLPPDDIRMEIGSGVLVRFGGHVFVFTAAHNVFRDGERALEKWVSVVAVHNQPINVAMQPGGGHQGVYVLNEPDTRGLVEPDVAVLVPGPNAILKGGLQPFEAEEIGFVGPDVACASGAVVAGFPGERATAPISTLYREDGPRLSVTGQWQAVRVDLLARRHFKEPASGRGVHVSWPVQGFEVDDGTPDTFPDPKGMSGGPLLVVQNGALRLIGLIRSKDDPRGLWWRARAGGCGDSGRPP